MMENELKPCPFCGNEAKIWSRRDGVAGFEPQCTNIDCIVTETVTYYPTATAAIAAWNARAGSPSIDAGEVERLVDAYREAVLQHHTARLRYPDTLSVTAHSNRENIARAALLEYVSKGGE